jgi:hypothetical protein
MFLERADWLVVSVSFIQSLLFASRSGFDPFALAPPFRYLYLPFSLPTFGGVILCMR